MPRRRSVVLIASLLAALAAPAAAAPGDDAAKARALSETAYEVAKAGRYDDAVELYLKAYELAPDPVLLYNLGRCEEKRGDRKAARAYYGRYVQEGKDPDLLAAARKALAAPADAPPARIEVACPVDGARVLVDDRWVGTTPLAPFDVAPGRHAVAVTHEGHADLVTEVVAPEGGTARVDATLVRLGDPVVPPVPAPAPAPVPAPAPAAAPVPAPAAAIAPETPRRSALYGAGVLRVGERAISVESGYPRTSVALHLHAGPAWDVAPHVDFFFARDVSYPVLGLSAGARFKLRVVHAGAFALAVGIDPGFGFDHAGRTEVSLRPLAPEVIASWRLPAGVTLLGALRVPFEVAVWPRPMALVPILFGLGSEFEVGPQAGVAVLLDLGPEVIAAPGVRQVVFSPIARLAFGWRW